MTYCYEVSGIRELKSHGQEPDGPPDAVCRSWLAVAVLRFHRHTRWTPMRCEWIQMRLSFHGFGAALKMVERIWSNVD